jgi:hypothetical protein
MCKRRPAHSQGFEGFFKDLGNEWVLNDRVVVGVQLRLVTRL